jgi:hypothetical protein
VSTSQSRPTARSDFVFGARSENWRPRPVEELSGQQVRLNNLGYFAGDVGEKDEESFRSAVEEFQCGHGSAVDGVCGPTSQAKLNEVHGW